MTPQDEAWSSFVRTCIMATDGEAALGSIVVVPSEHADTALTGAVMRLIDVIGSHHLSFSVAREAYATLRTVSECPDIGCAFESRTSCPPIDWHAHLDAQSMTQVASFVEALQNLTNLGR